MARRGAHIAAGRAARLNAPAAPDEPCCDTQIWIALVLYLMFVGAPVLQLVALVCVISSLAEDSWYAVTKGKAGLFSVIGDGFPEVSCDGTSLKTQLEARSYATAALCILSAVLTALGTVAAFITLFMYFRLPRNARWIAPGLSALASLFMAIALIIYGVTMQHWYFCGMRYCQTPFGYHPDYSKCTDAFAISYVLACVHLGCSALAAIGGSIVGCFVGRDDSAPDDAPAAATPAPSAPVSVPAADRRDQPTAPATPEGGSRRGTRPPDEVVEGEVAGARPDDTDSRDPVTGAAGNDAHHTWVDRRDPDGRTFYECAETGAMRWDRPAEYAAVDVRDAK